MKPTVYLSTFFLAILLFSCEYSMNTGGDQITATVNGEEWTFYNASLERTGDEMRISGQGYIGGDESGEPMNLQITIVGVPEQGEIETPMVAFFAPGTQELAAKATIIPVDQPLVFNTELDANAEGRIEITEANGSISGNFNFVAKDQGGRTLEVTNGKFNELGN